MDSKYAIVPIVVAVCTLTVSPFQPAFGQTPSNSCSLLTPAEVGAVYGVSVDSGQPLGRLCQWSVPNQPNSMEAKKVTVTHGDAQTFVTAKSSAPPAAVSIVSGIGDEAFYTTLPGATPGFATSLTVRKGNQAFIVHVYGIPDQTVAMTAEKMLALEILRRL